MHSGPESAAAPPAGPPPRGVPGAVVRGSARGPAGQRAGRRRLLQIRRDPAALREALAEARPEGGRLELWGERLSVAEFCALLPRGGLAGAHAGGLLCAEGAQRWARCGAAVLPVLELFLALPPPEGCAEGVHPGMLGLLRGNPRVAGRLGAGGLGRLAARLGGPGARGARHWRIFALSGTGGLRAAMHCALAAEEPAEALAYAAAAAAWGSAWALCEYAALRGHRRCPGAREGLRAALLALREDPAPPMRAAEEAGLL